MISRISGRRAFTLIELLVCIGVIGILYFIISPNAARERSRAETKTMVTRCNALMLAQASYRDTVGITAALAAWSGAADDEARYQLIKPYLEYSPASLATFVISGYSITFASDPRQAPTLKRGTTVISLN